MEKIENDNYSNDYNTTQQTNQPKKMFSTRRNTTTKKQSQSLLTDDYQQRDIIIQRRRQDIGKKNTSQSSKKEANSSEIMVCDEKDMSERMRNQKQKDKQRLKDWRRNRDTKKRNENILLLQSRRVKDTNKLLSVKVFDEYEEHEGTSVWKHYCNQAITEYCKDCFYGSTPIYRA